MGVRNRGTKAGLILSSTECSHLNSRLPSIPLPEKCTIFLRGGGRWAEPLDGEHEGHFSWPASTMTSLKDPGPKTLNQIWEGVGGPVW